MTGLMLLFVVVFVLVLAAVCGLLVLRMLGNLELPESPPFPHRRSWAHGHPRRHAGYAEHASEELVRKR